MRVFIAVNPTMEERKRLSVASSGLRDAGFPIRWVPAENVHLTLKFLGEVKEARVNELGSALGDAVDGVGAFEMVVHGFGAFPSPRRPNVVWVGIELNPSLETLQARVESALEKLGYRREERSFHPHLTLGRARKKVSASDFSGLDHLIERLDYDDRFRVSSVEVMCSRLMPSGAIYDVLNSAELHL
jgi:2'-5' RNA ligase